MSNLDYQQSYRSHKGQASRAATRTVRGQGAGDYATTIRELLHDAVRPGTLLGLRDRIWGLRQGCMMLSDPAVYEQFGWGLTEISRINLPAVYAGYAALFQALNQAAEDETELDAAQMLAAFRAGVANQQTEGATA